MGKARDYHGQPFDRHAGFCKLCWQWTEDRETNPVLETCVEGKNRKNDKKFAAVERPELSEKTLSAVRARLDEIIAASKSTNSPYLFGNLLFLYAGGYDHRILRDKGPESHEAQKMLFRAIKQNLIDKEWLSQSTRTGGKCFKPDLGDDDYAPESPSRIFCHDHNPRRSTQSRRRYQNDRKHITAFEAEIDKLYAHCMASGIGIHSDDDFLNLRQEACRNVFSSTLQKIKVLQTEGKTQVEIARMLGITRQAVTNALRREKSNTVKRKSSSS